MVGYTIIFSLLCPNIWNHHGFSSYIYFMAVGSSLVIRQHVERKDILMWYLVFPSQYLLASPSPPLRENNQSSSIIMLIEEEGSAERSIHIHIQYILWQFGICTFHIAYAAENRDTKIASVRNPKYSAVTPIIAPVTLTVVNRYHTSRTFQCCNGTPS